MGRRISNYFCSTTKIEDRVFDKTNSKGRMDSLRIRNYKSKKEWTSVSSD